jgi:hypothetical protein
MVNPNHRAPAGDKALPENSPHNLDRKLDHAIEETFPTSDPVSVSITKGGAIDYEASEQGGSSGRHRGSGASMAENLLGRGSEAISGVSEAASTAARAAYGRGREYLRSSRQAFPVAERYYRAGVGTMQRHSALTTLAALVAGIAIGYGLSATLRARRSDTGRVPDYARSRRRYSADLPRSRA